MADVSLHTGMLAKVLSPMISGSLEVVLHTYWQLIDLDFPFGSATLL